jgi:colicin import membrane protein
MRSFFSQHSSAALWSVALHAAVVAALAFGFGLPRFHRPAGQQLAIEATVVDLAAVEQERQRRDAEARTEQERLGALERERQARETAALEAKREAERKAEEVKRKAAEEAKRKAEQAAALEAKQEAERQARLEAERQAREEAERKAAEEAKRKAEEEARRKAEAEAERKRLAEEERKRKEEAAAARQQAELESELAREMAAEQARLQAQRSGLQDQYIRMITNRIEQNWLRPATARSGLDCVVNVTQIPSGEVVNVAVAECNGDDAVVRSIEAAVLRASPLPLPPVPALFERNLNIHFVPDD